MRNIWTILKKNIYHINNIFSPISYTIDGFVVFPFSTFLQLSCIKVFTILLQTLIDKKDIDIWCLKTFLLTQTLFVSNWGISKCENCGDFATDIYRALTTLNFEGCKVMNDWKKKKPFFAGLIFLGHTVDLEDVISMGCDNVFNFESNNLLPSVRTVVRSNYTHFFSLAPLSSQSQVSKKQICLLHGRLNFKSEWEIFFITYRS